MFSVNKWSARCALICACASTATPVCGFEEQSVKAKGNRKDAEQTYPGHMGEVWVVGGKIPKSVNEFSHMVTVVDELDISREAYSDVTEVLRKQAGIEFKQAGGVGQYNYLKVRGLDADNVLVVLDGVKINTASGGNTRNLFSQIDPQLIESLEIIRGPQATLYGANATAGVIVITTKSGKQASAALDIERGSLDWEKHSVSVRNTVNAAGGNVNLSLNTSKTDSENIHKYEFFKDKSLQLKSSYERDAITVGASLLSLDNSFGAAELDETYSALDSRAMHWAFQTPDPNNHSETREKVYSLWFDHSLSAELSQHLKLSRAENRYQINDRDDGFLGTQIATVDGIVAGSQKGDLLYIYDRSRGISVTPLTIDPAENRDLLANYRDVSRQLDYRLHYNVGTVSLLGGFEYQKQQSGQSGTYGTADNNDAQRSLYANTEIKLLDESLSLGVGLRFDDYDSWGEEVTGNLGVVWDLSSVTSGYANLGTSFKPATMSQLFNPGYGDSSLQPETGRSFELGIRHHAFADRLETELAYWNTRIEDVIFFDYSIANPRRSSGFGQYNNGQEARSSGVELRASYQLSEQWRLDGNYTYTDSHHRAVGDDWARTVQIARNKANLGLQFQGTALNLGINAYYSGPRLRWKGDVEMKEYLRFDASAHWQFREGLVVNARLENLLDEDIEEGLGYAAPGRYAVVGLEYRFL